MSTTVSFFGGVPEGLAISGFFLVFVPPPLASFVTSAVGFANVGGLAAVVVVVAVVGDAPVSPEPLGMSAVFVLLPQAARPMHAAASAGHLEWLMSRITAGTLAAQPKDSLRTDAREFGRWRSYHPPNPHEHPCRRNSNALSLQGAARRRWPRFLERVQERRHGRLRRNAASRRRVASNAAPRRTRRRARARGRPEHARGAARPVRGRPQRASGRRAPGRRPRADGDHAPGPQPVHEDADQVA